MALDRVQTTYQTQLLEYGVQAQAADDCGKLVVGWIRAILVVWKEQTKKSIEESSREWWTKWS